MNKLIIWDWNGTLLNDVDACVESMNIMLEKRAINKITTDYYKSIFTFPVKKYYKELGFDFEKESFEKLSIEYIGLYKKNSKNSPLQPGVVELLEYFKSKNNKQVILSASEQVALENQVKQRNILDYFDSLIGLDNIHAKGKINNAKDFIENSTDFYDQIVLIGDTMHDLEVAKEINAKCFLVTNGHQQISKEKINGYALVISSLLDLIEIG